MGGGYMREAVIKKTYRALIIDDSQDDREFFSHNLQQDKNNNWEILQAKSAEAAKEILVKEKVDIILLDYSLPQQNGLDFLKEFRTRSKYDAVIMLTGQGTEAIATEAMKYGANEYLVKDHITQTNMLTNIYHAMDHADTKKTIAKQRAELELFSYSLAHDLKEPVRTISSMVPLIEQKLENKNSELEKHFNFIEHASIYMQNLLSNLENYNRLESNPRTNQEVALDDVVSKACNNMQQTITERSAQINYQNLPKIHANETELIQLMQNLFTNAIKFCKTKPVIDVSAEEQNNMYQITVCDNAIGIASEDLEKIFDPLSRLNSGFEFPGTGLGLAICKKIVSKFSGEIWADSEPGKGSCFHFTIPR